MARKEKVKKPFYKKWWVWVIAVIVIFAATGGDGDDTADADQPIEEQPTSEATAEEPVEEEATEEEPAEEEEPIEETVGIGTPLSVGDVTFTINEVSKASNVGGEYGVDAKGEFLLLNVSVENGKKEAVTVDSSFFKLLIDGVEYEADSSAAIYANENAEFFYESVNPGLTLTGIVPFDAPPELDLTNAQVQVQTGIWGTETGLIDLK